MLAGNAAPAGAPTIRTAPWTAGVLSLATLPFVTRRVGDPDYWWHTLTGHLIYQQRAPVRADLYTYTVSGTPWTDHEYGSQLLFYGLTRAGGLTAVSVFFAVLILAGFWLILARARRLGAHPLAAGAALVLGAGAGFFMWGAEPQMFDFFFIALELLLVERFLAGRSRALYLVPPVVLVWANLHGGFVFAFLVLGILMVSLALRWAWSGRHASDLAMLRRAALVTVACVVASLITPWGPDLFLYVWRTQFSSQLSSFIAEWQSPDFHQASMIGFGIMLVLVLAGFGLRRPRLFDVLLVIAATLLALHAVRFTVVFVAVATPMVALQLTSVWHWLHARFTASRMRRLPPRDAAVMLTAALAIIAVGSVAFAANTLRGQTASTQANYPVAAADWLETHPEVGTRMFNQFDWGGYLSYRFYPAFANRRVFIYGEAELMGDQLLAEYVDVNQLHPDWQQVLDSHHVDYVVFAPGRPLDAALMESPDWQLAYSDSVADIFVRRSAVSPAALTISTSSSSQNRSPARW